MGLVQSSERDTLRASLNTTKKQLDAIRKESKRAYGLLAELRRVKDEQDVRIRNMSKTSKSVNSELVNVTNELKRLKEGRDYRVNEIKKLNKILNETNKRKKDDMELDKVLISKYKRDLEEYYRGRKRRIKELNMLKDRIFELDSQLESAEDESEELFEKNREQSLYLSKLEKSEEALSESLSDEVKKNKALEEKIKRTEEEKQTVREFMKGQNDDLSRQLNRLNIRVEKDAERYNKLEKTLDVSELSVVSLKKDKQNLNSVVSSLRNRLNSCRTNYKKMEVELKKSVSNQNRCNSDLADDKLKFDTEINKMEIKLRKLKNELKTSNETYNLNLKQEQESFKQCNDRYNNLNVTLGKYKTMVKNLEIKISEIQSNADKKCNVEKEKYCTESKIELRKTFETKINEECKKEGEREKKKQEFIFGAKIKGLEKKIGDCKKLLENEQKLRKTADNNLNGCRKYSTDVNSRLLKCKRSNEINSRNYVVQCPKECSSCKYVSGPGSTKLVNGMCTEHCSKDGKCGNWGSFVTNGVDCRKCSGFSKDCSRVSNTTTKSSAFTGILNTIKLIKKTKPVDKCAGKTNKQPESRCKPWVKSGYCNYSSYKRYMKTNCDLSCCRGGTTF